MAEDPNSFENIISTYNDIASGYEQMNKESAVGYGYQPIGPKAYAGQPGSYSTPSGALVTIGSPPGGVQGQSTDITGGTGRQTSGSGYGQVQSMGGGGDTRDAYKRVEFKAPGEFKTPEYKPPERDLAEEKQLRREYMAPGVEETRKATQQAIISSKSMDNPNARALFINKALQGVGTALGKITQTAGTQARAESTQRYQTELNKYYTGWKAQVETKKVNWDAQWNAAVLDFEQMRDAQMRGMDIGGGGGGSSILTNMGMQTPRDRFSSFLGK